jgi:predicted membrane channel-forming protein YqfA (hemolysin III family)
MLRLDKGDLEAIAKNRTNKQRLVRILLWVMIAVAIVCVITSFILPVVSCCIAWVMYLLLAIFIGLFISLMLIWNRRYGKLLEKIKKEYK